MRKAFAFTAAFILVSACDASKRTQPLGAPEPMTAQQGDSAFKAMDQRHGEAVGEDPMALAHQFESQPDGGDIILERQIHDDMGINQIRAHLLLIARSFSNGDFKIPGFVHDEPIPGTAVMTRLAGKIDYTVEDLPHGGVVHIRTSDPEALQAIHSVIAFQIAEHRTVH